MMSTKLASVRTSCDLPIATVTMAVRLLPAIWITRCACCACALPIMPSTSTISANANAIARSRAQLPHSPALSERRQSKPAAKSLLLFTTHSPPH